MENRQQPVQTDAMNQDQGTGSYSKTGSFICRQTSARWTPTADQIRILKELYYNAGVRSPNAEQIQKISARLRQYGKIEGKNVFYWFQNHKARERQKKRFGSTTNTNMSSSSSSSSPIDHHHHHQYHHANVIPMQRASIGNINNNNYSHDHLFHSKFPNFNKGYYHSSSGPECMINAAIVQTESYGYGSVTMEKHFRDCSISQGGSTSGYNVPTGRAFMDRHHYYNFLDKPKPLVDTEGYEEDGAEGAAYVDAARTLPLFPMHGEDQVNGGGFWRSNGGYVNANSYGSLELSLNSYTGVTPD